MRQTAQKTFAHPRAPSAAPARAAFAASSPVLGRGYEIPAYAGMTGMGRGMGALPHAALAGEASGAPLSAI